MAQGLGHLDGRLFWALAVPSYIASAYAVRILVRLAHEEIWYRRAAWRASHPRQESNLRQSA